MPEFPLCYERKEHGAQGIEHRAKGKNEIPYPKGSGFVLSHEGHHYRKCDPQNSEFEFKSL